MDAAWVPQVRARDLLASAGVRRRPRPDGPGRRGRTGGGRRRRRPERGRRQRRLGRPLEEIEAGRLPDHRIGLDFVRAWGKHDDQIADDRPFPVPPWRSATPRAGRIGRSTLVRPRRNRRPAKKSFRVESPTSSLAGSCPSRSPPIVGSFLQVTEGDGARPEGPAVRGDPRCFPGASMGRSVPYHHLIDPFQAGRSQLRSCNLCWIAQERRIDGHL